MRKSAKSQAEWIEREIGPQQVGGTYFCGYWRDMYTVEDINRDTGDWRVWSITVRWSDGHVTRHATAWDAKRDRIISQPTAGASA